MTVTVVRYVAMGNSSKLNALFALLLIGNSVLGSGTPSSLFPISVINLDRDTARLVGVSEQLKSAGVSLGCVERLPAVYGASLSPKELKENASLLARLFATKGMIGCYLSHRYLHQLNFQRCPRPPPQIAPYLPLQDILGANPRAPRALGGGARRRCASRA